jgi:Aspartyl protease
MINFPRAWQPVLLFAFTAAIVLSPCCNLIAQTPAPAAAPQQPPDATSLQQLLDRDDYIGYSTAMRRLIAGTLTSTQQQYFLGMLGFHAGHLDRASTPLMAAVNARDKSLTSEQIESALETLAQIDFKLCRFNEAALYYGEIDRVFGSRLGDDQQSIRDNGHLAALLKDVPPQTVQISADFTLPRTGLDYPVSIPNRRSPQPLFAQLDTGAEVSLLSESTATAWGVTLLDGSATLHGYGGGAFAAHPGLIPALTIGEAELHNVPVYVTADSNLYIAQIKRQTNALLGYSVVAALGRITFARDGSLTVHAQSPSRDLHTSAALWLASHSLLVELGTQPIFTKGKITGSAATRLFMLDTGSSSTLLTDHYLAEHTDAFHGAPPEIARLAGGGGIHAIAAYGAKNLPLFAGDTLILLNGPHILARPSGSEVENFFGLLGQNILGIFSSYTIDFRNMSLTLSP